MTEVRRYTRRTASGRTASVRRHTRNTGDGGGERERAAWADRVAANSPAPHVSSLPPAERDRREEWWAEDDGPPPGEFWDEDDAGEEDEPERAAERPSLVRMKQEMRDRRALGEPEPGPPEPMNPQLAKALGCDTPEGRAKHERLRAYRESGYTGPLDGDGNIPDPDDPAEQRALELLAALSETHG